ncbi:ABC transporter ATP-binding protein [Calothrix sp. 336/3]|uniref:ABC transporter ATP-binding protein n=1 Tax=Calothrix sp. 336/3 TaxID=1337936 RepID=UPI0004E2943F|nr:ABC transporter ATP-binding protein [Calothrix sp. 336/3]AKG24242.1 ABC transporter [Calothrix sp. 336/3]
MSLLEVRNLCKFYPGCVANREVNLLVERGEIHALLGENGAGKSTLMQMIYGVLRPDAGEILWQGNPVTINSPSQGRSLGMGMVFQHFSLLETLTVTENIALSLPPQEKWNLSRVDRQIRILSREYGLEIHPERPVYSLSVGEKQRVEIIRCLMQTTQLLILDEPTAVLTPREVEQLFTVLRRLAADGCGILFSSHKLKEVQALCHQATVLRRGEVVGKCNPQRETPETMASLLVGTEILQTHTPKQKLPGATCLRVQNLSLSSPYSYGTALHNINLQLRSGEIIGIAGVAGNGQRELLAVLSGEILSAAKMLMLGEMPIGDLGVVKRRRLGMGYAPEERLEKGILPQMNLPENALLTAYGQGLIRRGLIRREKLTTWTRRICSAFNVNFTNLQVPSKSLSGGNLQKFIIGREIQQNPAVLIIAHPTWGVDVQAKITIHNALLEMRDTGTGILVVSEDLEELFTLCDRLTVIYRGRLSPLVAATDTNYHKIGRLMTGIDRN